MQQEEKASLLFMSEEEVSKLLETSPPTVTDAVKVAINDVDCMTMTALNRFMLSTKGGATLITVALEECAYELIYNRNSKVASQIRKMYGREPEQLRPIALRLLIEMYGVRGHVITHIENALDTTYDGRNRQFKF